MRTVLIPILGLSLVAAGCAGGDGASDDGRRTVVAAFFPLADAVREVAGDTVHVTDLTPPGVEPHELDLSSDEVDAVLDADLVIVLGGGFQPAVEDVAADRDGPTLDISAALDLDLEDPHVWLDPSVMARIASVVATALDADPAPFVADLDALDERFHAALSSCESDLIVASHDAFGYLARRYDLRLETISGLVPEDEPDPAGLDHLADLVEQEGVTTIFTEPLLPARAAETLARETHTKVATLDPLESDPGSGYVRAMEANLDALTAALRCSA